MNKRTIKIGTRGSQLALYQAYRVKKELQQLFPEINPEIIIIKTKGDKILDVALSKIGDKGLFTKELEVALINGNIDMAVHSLKDMPTELPQGLKLGAVLERGEINDAVVSLTNKTLKTLDSSHKIATSSLRRIAGILNFNPDFNIVDIRGNVNTRLQKMKDGYCDAMIMAATGLKRLGLEEYISEIISPEILIPAVSQGAIGIETRENDNDTVLLMQKINHLNTWISITAERAYMNKLQGGCQIPVGCYSKITENQLTLKGFVASIDGKKYLKQEISGNYSEAKELGITLAENILNLGGDKILNDIRNS